MTSKTAVLPLVREHLATLRHARTDKPRVVDHLTQYGLPVLVGVVAPLAGVRLQDAGQIIAGAAVLSGFSFGLAIYVFQLRMEAARDPRVPRGGQLLDLLDELFANVRYSILAGLLAVVVATCAVAFHDGSTLNAWWTGGVIAIGVHYILTILMCLKRLGSAYRRLTI